MAAKAAVVSVSGALVRIQTTSWRKRPKKTFWQFFTIAQLVKSESRIA